MQLESNLKRYLNFSETQVLTQQKSTIEGGET
jgi:hypothetical protein